LHDIDLGDDVLEVGPGPGLTTRIIRNRAERLTAIEIDEALADALRVQLAGTNVTVVHGDGARMPFNDRAFTGATCFTMLHHVPTAELQDRLFAEVYRVLEPGATFAGSDSLDSLLFRIIHLRDTMVIVDPAGVSQRLTAVGFIEVAVSVGPGAFRFRCRKPQAGHAA